MCVLQIHILYVGRGEEKKERKNKCVKVLELLSVGEDSMGVHFSVVPTCI